MRVTVLERGPWLLRRQLDARAAALLASYLHGLGIEILFQTEVAALVCDDRVRVATLKSGEDLACEVFVVCAGIVPQVELACRPRLAVGRGIRVDSRMATRDAAIFAAGDCAEFDGEIPGLWPTAVEQGRVAGANAVGGDEIYVPQAPCTALKVAGIDVASFGRIDAGEGETEVVREDEATRRYRKFVLREGRLAGAILIGCPEWSLGVQRALKGGRDLGALAGQLAGDDPAVFG
ncbi:MAG: FAD-dependent oxidoreductase [Sulfuritalea sp.]|nr:FAD-dependent oxidoreductase [Sulfuritalea sp.]